MRFVRYFLEHKKRLSRIYQRWQKHFGEGRRKIPRRPLFWSLVRPASAADLLVKSPRSDGREEATRICRRDVLQPIDGGYPLVIGGSAATFDEQLYSLADKDFDPTNRGGRIIRFGIRDTAWRRLLMAWPMTESSVRTIATFLYSLIILVRRCVLRRFPTCRLSTSTRTILSVGEDGPTHQPVETVSALRLIPTSM